ncbi:hypothetical protein SRHO_G00032390 [Serrasalmus rhombeus]
MAALLARQHMLKEKHAIEEQEEQLRRKKEQLQLEADIAATAAKVNMLRIGSTVRSTTSRKSNGMESYFKTKDKTFEVLNADAETFVPQTLDVNAKGNITIGNAKPKVKTVQQSVKGDKPAPFLMGPFDPSTPCSTIPCLPLQQAACPVTSGNLLSIMEKQSELTSMLVYQQGLSSLPKREIPVFDGSPLHFHAFMRSFEQVIEAKTSNADDRLHYLARHPSILHIHHKEKKEVKSDTETDKIPVTVQTSGLTGAGGQDCKLAIVPVKVKSKKSQRTVETCAFLDQGSSASFRTVGLLDKLNLAGRKTKILLRTMGQEKVVDSFIVTELEVAGLDSDLYYEMSDLFTQHRMPVNVCNIPKQQDVDDWPHLKHVYLPERRKWSF